MSDENEHYPIRAPEPAPTDAPAPADPDAARRAAEEFREAATRYAEQDRADTSLKNSTQRTRRFAALVVNSPLPRITLDLAAEVERLRLVRDTSLAHARRLARAAKRALDDRRDGGRADLGPLWEAMGEFAAFYEGLTGEEKGGDSA